MLKKLIPIALILIVAALAFGLYAYFKESTDYSNKEPDTSISLSELLQKVDTDTSALNKMRNQLVLINEANVQTIQADSNMSVLVLGTSTSSSTVVAQIDPRHNDEVKNIKQGQTISIKGIFSDYTLDTDLGLGNTIQLNFCTLPQ